MDMMDNIPNRGTELPIKPCRCELGPGEYNMGQFHMRERKVVARCPEYCRLSELVENGTVAIRHADPFAIETTRLKGRVALARVRLEELKAGGVNQ